MKKIYLIIILSVASIISVEAQQPIKDFIRDYYSSLNNLGDVSIERQHLDELQSKILNNYFRMESSLIDNDLRPNGVEFYKAYEYFDVLRMDFVKGFTIDYYLIGNIFFNEDGDLVSIINHTITDLGTGNKVEGNYLLVIAFTSYNLTTFTGFIKSITRYKSKIDKKSELEKQKEADDLEVSIWNYTKQINTVKGYEEYITNYPNSRFKNEAHERMTQLAIIDEKEKQRQDSIYNSQKVEFSLAQREKRKQDSIELAKLQAQLDIEKLRKENNRSQSDIFLANLRSRMIALEGGSFVLGCQDVDCESDEGPATKIELDSFYIGKYEVTVEEWQTIMGDLPSDFENGNCPKCPISNVSYYDITTFLERLNKMSGEKYRLPLEREWEYAASGNGTKKYAGSDSAEEAAEFRDNNGVKSISVINTKANEFGLHGMSGNVAEWCKDWYAENAYQLPREPAVGEHRVIRGGSYIDRATNVRVKSRDKSSPGATRSTIGFRLAKDANN